MHIGTLDPESVEALLQQAYVKDPAITVEKALATCSAFLGEGISVTRFVRWSEVRRHRPFGVVMRLILGQSSHHTYPRLRFIQSYSSNGLVGVLVEFGLETWRVTERPEFLEVSRFLALYIATRNPKSLDMLLQQPITRGPPTVEKFIATFSRILRERISITRFVRWGDSFEPAVPPKDPAVALRLKRA